MVHEHMITQSYTSHSPIPHACSHATGREAGKAELLRHIEDTCAQRHLRFTPMRKEVVLTLLATHQPMGAYDLLATLSQKQDKQLAPVTIYRALDFLVEHGFVHKLETQNAYIACTSETHHTHNHGMHEGVVFLMCTSCGGVDEVQAAHVHDALKNLMQTTGFSPRSQVLEFSGLCEHCKES
jgi:Fur family transcriptional regulator, zinc uptake regulator